MILDIVRRALREDIGRGDITTQSVVPAGAVAAGAVIARREGVVAGLEVARLVLREVDAAASFEGAVRDGAAVGPNTQLAQIEGAARSLLTAERTLLNFMQRMSGIATLTARFVEAVKSTGARILDTRKTAPGLRCLDKWAVALGGGANHRFGLFDGVLIKDNHLRLAGGVREAVTAARAHAHHGLKIQVEVETIEQARQALDAGADALLLDNMALDVLRQAVAVARGRALTEASGGVTLDNVRAIADSGVDFISVGALTHSAPALDIALEITVC